MSTSSHTMKSRFDVSLARLTRRFMELVSKAPDGVLDINDVAWMLGVRKRRIYDITNVLDGIHLLRKKSKNLIEWVGKNPQERLGYEAQSRKLRKELADLTTVENSLDELIKDCAQQLYNLTEDKENARLAYVTYKDIHGLQAFKEQIVIAIKAPQETKLEVPIPTEEKIQVYIKSTEGPIDVFVCEMQEEYCPPKTCEDDASNGNKTVSSTDEAVTLPPDRASYVKSWAISQANKKAWVTGQIFEDWFSESDNNDEVESVELQVKDFTVKQLAEFFKAAEHLAQMAVDMDPSLERSQNFSRSLQSILLPYKQIYAEKQNAAKQTTLTNFFKPMSSHATSSCESSVSLPSPLAVPDDPDDTQPSTSST